MMTKRIAAILLCVLMLAVSPMAVFAEEAASSMETLSKTYTLNMSEVQGFIRATPNTAAFWEYPVLKAGEDFTEGTLIVRNDSRMTANMELTSVTLPYGDEAKMAYLNHVMLTVSQGDTVLYNNTYAHINDENGGLKLSYPAMAPGEEHMYTIKLRCLYTYEGDPYTDASQLSWNFAASGESTLIDEPDGLPEWAMILVITLAVTIAVLIVIMIVRGIISLVKKKKNPIDNNE